MVVVIVMAIVIAKQEGTPVQRGIADGRWQFGQSAVTLVSTPSSAIGAAAPIGVAF